jgi:hypothetical protein
LPDGLNFGQITQKKPPKICIAEKIEGRKITKFVIKVSEKMPEHILTII